jgi:hypothetical protein
VPFNPQWSDFAPAFAPDGPLMDEGYMRRNA